MNDRQASYRMGRPEAMRLGKRCEAQPRGGSRRLGFEWLEPRALLAAVTDVNVPAAPVQSLDVVFSHAMAIDVGTVGSAVSLVNLRDGERHIGGGSFSYNGATRTLTWTLGETLPRGFYELRLDGSRLLDTGGAALQGGVGGLTFSTPEFQPSAEVLANAQPIDADDYSVPSLADWNSDGRLDLLVGLKTPAGEGKVRVYLNAGTNESPQYGTFSYAQQAGADLVVSGAGCMGMYPRLSDWDGDGRKDLVVGLASGGVQVFPNVGTAADPRFGAPSDVMVGEPGSKQPINVGARATPEIVDWNNDGRYDLVVGGLDGNVRVYINAAASGAADFRAGTLVQDGGIPLVVPTGRASGAVVDLDGDSRQDLLLGNTEGQLLFYRNVGTDAAPLFDGWELVPAGGQVVDLPGTPRSRPFVGDANADGMPDLLVGSQDGLIRRYAAATWPVPLEGAGNQGLLGSMYRFTFDACVRAWTNPAIARDVDGDGAIARHDGQLVFDELNGRTYANAVGQLGQVPRHGLAPPHLDVNGDGYCLPLDALLIVHYLNTTGQGGEGEAAEQHSPIVESIAAADNAPVSRADEREDGIADAAATQSDGIPRHASPQVEILSAPRDDDAVSLMDNVAVRALFGNDADIDSLLAGLFGEQGTPSA